MKKNAIFSSYKKHKKHYKSKNKNIDELYIAWSRKDTTDYWRHQRMYKNLNPLLSDKKASWLTVGDGRFGRDANYIISNGVKNVLATDIDDSLLKVGKKNKFIHSYQKANAEKLSFEDNKFDYVLCKESFHHFPRPFIALYELIRVAKKGVILIEPHDIPIASSPVAIIKYLFHPSKFTHINKHEESGNFVYGISTRELEKVALGIDLPARAYRGFDDHHIIGVEEEKFNIKAKLAKKIIRKLTIAKILKNLKLRQSSMMTYVLFKKQPTNKVVIELTNQGYKYNNLPRNPYI